MPELRRTLTITTDSARATEALATALGAALTGRQLILLSGELGAGKTVFVRGIARGLGVPADVAITSPTYVLLHAYRGGRLTLYHIDAYRLHGGADEFEASGLLECLDDPAGVVCIEWPEKAEGRPWPADHLFVSIEHDTPTTRILTFSATGTASVRTLAALPS